MWVDSVYSFPIKKCQPIRKAVFELVRKVLAWKVTENWDKKNNWLVEGRTVLIYKGGDRKYLANFRPITCLPTITKMVTLAIHMRMRKWLLAVWRRASSSMIIWASELPKDARRHRSRISPSTYQGRKRRKMWWSYKTTSRMRMITSITTFWTR